jgi:hypothetical protein
VELTLQHFVKNAALAKQNWDNLIILGNVVVTAEDDKIWFFALALEVLLADGILEQKRKRFYWN